MPSPTILHANMSLLLRRYDMAIAQSRAMMDEAVTEEKWYAAADLVSAACTLSGLISQLTIEVAEEETAVQPPHDETPPAVALVMLVRAAAATCTEDARFGYVGHLGVYQIHFSEQANTFLVARQGDL